MPSTFSCLRRIGDPLSPDPGWGTLQRPVGPAASVSSVDTDGIHSYDIHTTGGGSVTVSHTRLPAEGDGAVSDAWAADANARLSTDLRGIITFAESDGAGTVYHTPLHDGGQQAAPFTVDNFVVQGGATISSAPSGEFPITAEVPHGSNGVSIVFRLVDATGSSVGDNLTYADIEIITNDTTQSSISVLKRALAHRLVDPIEALVPPGTKFTVRLASAISLPPPPPFEAVIVLWSPTTI